MKLSLVFELLLIFILLAFAASKSVKNQRKNIKKQIQTQSDSNEVDKIEENSINRYCKCAEAYCNCCRDFRLPLVELNGPGCASLMYLNGDKMSVSLSFGKKVITNRTLSSRKPSPVCMPLPGGISKFCGRVYNIARAGEEFRACLGLELQSKKSVEAAVRVSCFKFGPRGVTSEPADPLPLVPQDEKSDDDDDDDDDYDDDDDDFGLSSDDDDDDDDDDGTIDAVNDVDTADYAGFSLLGEDILGDLFGSSGGKKSKKNNKKQAPISTTTTTTTTTRRPRPSRRPSRKPSTRVTTPRPTRSTTVRSRPSRRPTRKPSRRPNRKPTTESTSTSILTSTTLKPVPMLVTAPVQITEQMQVINKIQEDTFDPVSVIAIKPTASILPITTPKAVTNFEDPGLEMSLAHITGQLSAMPVTPMISNQGKDSAALTTAVEQSYYEKIPTITPKSPSTVAFDPSFMDTTEDDMVQIVQSLDSHEREPEKEPEREFMFVDETRGHGYNGDTFISDSYFDELKKQRKRQFNMHDLDVLDLTKIGESLGDELGIFNKNRKHRDNKDTKVQGEKEHNDDYDDLVDAIGHTLMMRRKSDNDNKNKKNRNRQNKMMRGEWSSQPVTS